MDELKGTLKAKPKGAKTKGQISIMMGVMMLTFIMMFAFVINTGMLVHAKINLQNAADLAAYAGAAVQARQLNHISYLNYEMRRQYKKFLYRVYVVGNNSQDTFPKPSNPGGKGQKAPWQPNAGVASYEVPTICVIFNSNDNYCHNALLTGIAIPPQTPLDQINQTLRDQLIKLEDIRTRNCEAIGDTNYDLARFWLFNVDPTLKDLIASVPNADAQKRLGVIQSLSFGLGLLPKEFILRNRISTLTAYINSKALTGVTRDRADGLRGAADQAMVERTVQAYFSAYYTLGTHSFPSNGIQLDELIPATGEDGGLIKLHEHTDKFDLYPLRFKAPATGQGNCEAQITPVIIPQPISLGVYKDPKVMTYYAIRLRARAKLLFCPFCNDEDGTLQLTAYSAAQPFGSRIGPSPKNIGANQGFTRAGEIANIPVGSNALNITKRIPNLPIFKGDSTARGKGWDDAGVLTEMFKKLEIFDGTGNIVGDINQANLETAYQAAMVPNPFEGNFYNIPMDQGATDPYIKYFDVNNQYAFWAPIFPIEKIGQAQATLATQIDLYLQGNNPAAGVGATGPGLGTDLDVIKKGMNAYISRILDGKTLGDDDEGFRVVRLRNPFLTRPAIKGDPSIAISIGDDIALTDPKLIKTSWNEVRDAEDRDLGRVGYSVKFVSFDSITKGDMVTDGEVKMGNSPSFDLDGVDQDMHNGTVKH